MDLLARFKPFFADPAIKKVSISSCVTGLVFLCACACAVVEHHSLS